MCGRYALGVNPDELREVFDLVHAEPFAPRYNIAPSSEAPVVLASSKRGGWSAERLTWGLVPAWAGTPELGRRAFNARLESAREKPMFRESAATRRCLVPATGYYEWAGSGRTKQPWFFSARDAPILALAGLWSRWRAPEGGLLHTFSVLTQPAEGAAAAVHHRMPVRVAPSAWSAWLEAPADEAFRALATPVEITQHPVGASVGSVSAEGEALTRPAARGALQGTMLLDGALGSE